MWSSFPCIYIPNRIAKAFVEWFYDKACYDQKYDQLIFNKMGDDRFFRDYINEFCQDERVINHVPALIDHIDWLIGGSVANRHRGTNCRAYYWTNEDAIDALRYKLCEEGHREGVLF